MIHTHLSFKVAEHAPRSRDEACARMRKVVHAIARSACGARGRVGALDVDDLVATGMIGVLQAYDAFDPAQGTDFVQFARHRARGAIYDAMRRQDTVSRRRRGLGREMRYAESRAAGDNGQRASATDIARALGMDVDAYHKAVQSTRSADVVSLDSPSGDESDGRLLGDVIADDDARGASDHVWQTQLHAALHRALSTLPERAREAVVRYHLEGVPQALIAADHGVTVSRVSQILSAAREALRQELQSSIDPADLA